jgi:CIC family chloride channel protein
LAGFVSPHLLQDPVTAAVIGMSAFAVAVVGGPLTMTFMALETTGDFVITGIVLAAAVFSSMTVRELFGYSFSTWRLHLRGETIRSPHDVGWIRSLTVGRLMQTTLKTVRHNISMAEFRQQFPLGSLQSVVVLDDAGRYAGMVSLTDVYAQEGGQTRAESLDDLLRQKNVMLLPAMNIQQAIAVFDANETEVLAVVDDPVERNVVGLLSEFVAMRRYAEELDQARRALAGEHRGA